MTTLELPEDAAKLARTNTPLSVIGLGGSALVVTETDPQIPSLSEKFRVGLEKAGVSEEELMDELEDTKRELAEEGPGDGDE